MGGRRIIDVIDCKTLRSTEMSLREFEQYFDGKDRKCLYNAVSLEFSKSKLEAIADRPSILDYVDWVDLVWPQHLKQEHSIQSGLVYPKVQRFCLMSVAGCFSDFHVEFGGTSVWYYQFKGERTFWLIPPTQEIFSLYEGWVTAGCQTDIFFGDLASDCQRVCLEQGQSLIIPGGWVFAVFTSKDSIAFSGNFLHSFNIPLQLEVYEMEKRIGVPCHFQFPFFTEIHWYALERYVHTLSGISFLNDELQFKALPKYQKGSCDKENDSLKDHVHVTPFERSGLQTLIDVFEKLSPSEKSVPDGINDENGLLKAGRKLLFDHANDDSKLAVTGKPKAYWPQLLRQNGAPKKIKLKPKLKKPPVQLQKKAINSSRIRRIRCKVCEACTSDDCRECVFCKDMRKYGGPGTMKQTCIKRRCLNPILPSTAGASEEAVVVTAEKVEVKPETTVGTEKSQPEFEEVFVPMKVPKLEIDELMMEEAFDDSLDSQYFRSIVSTAPPIVTRKSEHELFKYAIPPAPKIETSSVETENSLFLKGKIKAWEHVFLYTSQKDLCSCMLVCKDFLRICGSPKFWKSIDLTAKRINPTTLQCLVRRAPKSLNLSQTNINYKQLTWLLERSPCLRSICLEGCSWSAVAALNTAACPPLKVVDISWIAGFTDPHLKHLLSTPKDTRPGQVISHSQLCFCEKLVLSGTDVTDKGLRLLSQQLPNLTSVDVSFCNVTSDGIGYFTNPASKCQHLGAIIAKHCPHVTDKVFVHIGKLQKIKTLDFRECSKITPSACEEFIVKFPRLNTREPLYILDASV